MYASDVAMQTWPAQIVPFAVFATPVLYVPIRLVICAVTQPAIDIQVFSSAIGFVEVAVMHRKQVSIFQVREATILAFVKSLCQSDIRNFSPQEGITAVLFNLPSLINPKEDRQIIVRNGSHGRHKFV